jgi:hypothetical protein
MSFLVQPRLQHIPATPREKFLFLLDEEEAWGHSTLDCFPCCSDVMDR